MAVSEAQNGSDAPDPAAIQLAEASLHRCASTAFFQAFYRRLLVTDEVTRHKFDHTDFERQHKLLQHGLGLLFSYAKRRNPALLERIAVRHAKPDLDVAPSAYPHFVESLLAAVREFDPSADPTVEDAWRRAMAPGITFMAMRYAPSAPGGD